MRPSGEATVALIDGERPPARLPRHRAGSQPQHLLLTILADYFAETSEPIASASLVTLLAEFGVTDAGARAALSRVSRRGLLASTKRGRATYYRLTEEASLVLGEEARTALSFGSDSGTWWGHWTVVTFSLPEHHRRTRTALRTRLRRLGFAPLYDGVWVSPYPPTAALDVVLEDLGVDRSSIFVGDLEERGDHSAALSAWPIGELARHYEEFIADFAGLHARVARGVVGSAEALVARTSVMDRWRRMPEVDPDLPADLLPGDWPRRRARALFVEIYDSLGELAELRVRQIVAASDTPLAGRISHHTTASLTG